MSFLNEQAAENAGKEVARQYFQSRKMPPQSTQPLLLDEGQLALIAKLAFEAGVQAVLHAEQAIQDEQDEQARDEQDP
jgi:hypothetical protein